MIPNMLSNLEFQASGGRHELHKVWIWSDIEAWCTVRPYCQAAESYRVALQCGELIQIARFYPQMVEFAQMYQNKF